MSSGRVIDYEALAQDAMRGVVRAVLARTAKSGLPGDHHFYISFDTQARGVVLSKRLRDKYPEEMTIVLQHRFWDLNVTEDRFEVKLTFDGIPERLVVPFSALKIFFDPSVRYGLQFETPDYGPDTVAHPQASSGEGESMPSGPQPSPFRSTPRPVAERKPARGPRRTKAADRAGDQDESNEAGISNAAPAKPAPAKAEKPQESASESPEETPPSSGAQIVRLDAFRKK